MLPAIDSEIVTWDAPVSYWPIFPSLVSVPEVLAKVSAQFPCFFSSEKGFVNRFRSTQSDKNSTYILV